MYNFENLLLERAIIRGGLQLYGHRDAMLLVDLCTKHNVQILGIDGFLISNEKTYPKMEHSIDLSAYTPTEANSIARKFLEQKAGMGLLFEVVY